MNDIIANYRYLDDSKEESNQINRK